MGLITFLILSTSASAQKWAKIYADTNLYSIQTATIAGNNYIGYIHDNVFYLVNAKGNTILKRNHFYFDWEFKDFNKDGHLDITLTHSGNTPLVFDLYVYIPQRKTFKEIKNFHYFPEPEHIKGTMFYYSYHKSGCADMNWDSDLFYIENFKAIRTGNIAGRQCNGDITKSAIYINKVRHNKLSLLKTLPIDTIGKYQDYKWGFIKEYWTNNYKRFR